MAICQNEECGKEFKRTHQNQKYCCTKCNKRQQYLDAKKRNAPRECGYSGCGKIFKPFSKDTKYCSVKCARLAQYEREKEKKNRKDRDFVEKNTLDFFPTKSGIPGIGTNSVIYNPMG